MGSAAFSENGIRVLPAVVAALRQPDNAAFAVFRDNLLRTITLARRRHIRIDIDRIRMLSIRSRRLLVGPQRVHINIQDQCNYRCQFCFTHSALFSKASLQRLDKEHSPSVPFWRIRDILDDAHAIGTELVSLCGAGEPLLHPRIIPVIEYALSLGLRVQIFTNLSQGARLTDLDTAGRPLSFLVNVAAVTASQYEAVHGVSRKIFPVVRRHIKNLIKKGHDVVLSCQIIRGNCNSIGDYISMASGWGVKEVLFALPKLYEPEVNGLMMSAEEREHLRSAIGSLEALARAKHVRTNLSVLRGILDDAGLQQGRGAIDHTCGNMKCFNPWFYSKVQTNGDVHICCHDTVPVGRVTREVRFRDVFFSHRALEIAKEGSAGVDARERQWRKCGMCRDKDRNIRVAREVLGQ